MRINLACLSFAIPLCAVCFLGQDSTPVTPPAAGRAVTTTKGKAREKTGRTPRLPEQLHLETVKIPSEIAEVFVPPLRCDREGNLYLRTNPDGLDAVRKLNQKGQRVAVFTPNSVDLKVDRPGYFHIAPDGDVYQLVYAHEISRYVFVYKPSGTVKSEIKLQPGFPFSPYQLAVFPSGDMLVSGLEYDKDRSNPVRWPFTGIFSSDGSLKREIKLEDDNDIHNMAASGDDRVVLPAYPSSNLAVSAGAAETAADGNVYLMRRLSPAIVYAISAGGEIVRRFTVDVDDPDYMPSTVHIAGSSIAVLFREAQTRREIIKVVDLEGREIATYAEPVVDGAQALGGAFICYANNPDRFTFLKTMEDDRLGIVTATPQQN